MQLKGIYAPIVTPFNADESINYPVLEGLIEYLIANKIAGLVPGSTTGEVTIHELFDRLRAGRSRKLELQTHIREFVVGFVTFAQRLFYPIPKNFRENARTCFDLK